MSLYFTQTGRKCDLIDGDKLYVYNVTLRATTENVYRDINSNTL